MATTGPAAAAASESASIGLREGAFGQATSWDALERASEWAAT
jgi:hypothetical protein